jgi:PEP-CTERM motif
MRSGRVRWAAWVAGGVFAIGFSFQAGRGAALTLADLADGEGFTTANGVSFENFRVKVKGKVNSDLSDYEVFKTTDGFVILDDGGPERDREGRGRFKLSFDVSSDDPAGFQGGAIGIDPGDERVKVRKQLFDGSKRIAKLLASTAGPLSDLVDLGGARALHVKETIRVGGGLGGASVMTRFDVVPEPSTAALLAIGLAATAALRRRRA